MSTPPTESEALGLGFDGLRDYTLLALGGLLIITLILMLEGLGWWAMLPLLAGGVGVLTTWGVGPSPVLFLLILILGIYNEIWRSRWGHLDPSSPLVDAAFAIGLLAYVAGHCRLLALRRWAIPPDPRRGRLPQNASVRGRWFLPAGETRRSPGRVGAGELLSLLASLPVFLIFASLIWINVAVAPEEDEFGFSPSIRQALGFAWLGAVVLAIGWGVSGYLGRLFGGRSESLLFLQDQLWDATRGEQRQITRTVVAGRLRRQKREESS